MRNKFIIGILGLGLFLTACGVQESSHRIILDDGTTAITRINQTQLMVIDGIDGAIRYLKSHNCEIYSIKLLQSGVGSAASRDRYIVTIKNYKDCLPALS